jgi:hypothetical protein
MSVAMSVAKITTALAAASFWAGVAYVLWRVIDRLAERLFASQRNHTPSQRISDALDPRLDAERGQATVIPTLEGAAAAVERPAFSLQPKSPPPP